MKTIENPIKKNLKDGTPSYGIIVHWPSPEMIEVSGFMGFDWVWIDIEHGTYDPQTLLDCVRAADASGIVPIARVPKTRDREQVLAWMETGLQGILSAHTQTKEDVEFLVDAVKYPPVGKRSAGLMRSARWGVGTTSKEYYEAANRETLVMALVEEREGLDNLDEILSVPELDVVMIGPGDLSLSMGYPGEPTHPEPSRLRKEAEDKILAAGKGLMVITYSDADLARTAVERGALMPVCGSQGLFMKAANQWLQDARG